MKIKNQIHGCHPHLHIGKMHEMFVSVAFFMRVIRGTCGATLGPSIWSQVAVTEVNVAYVVGMAVAGAGKREGKSS